MVADMKTTHVFKTMRNLSSGLRCYSGSRKLQDAIPSHTFHILISIFHAPLRIYKSVLLGFKIHGMQSEPLDVFMKADCQLNLKHFANSCNLSLNMYHKINFRLPVLSAFFFDNVTFHKGQNFPVIRYICFESICCISVYRQ